MRNRMTKWNPTLALILLAWLLPARAGTQPVEFPDLMQRIEAVHASMTQRAETLPAYGFETEERSYDEQGELKRLHRQTIAGDAGLMLYRLPDTGFEKAERLQGGRLVLYVPTGVTEIKSARGHVLSPSQRGILSVPGREDLSIAHWDEATEWEGRPARRYVFHSSSEARQQRWHWDSEYLVDAETGIVLLRRVTRNGLPESLTTRRMIPVDMVQLRARATELEARSVAAQRARDASENAQRKQMDSARWVAIIVAHVLVLGLAAFWGYRRHADDALWARLLAGIGVAFFTLLLSHVLVFALQFASGGFYSMVIAALVWKLSVLLPVGQEVRLAASLGIQLAVQLLAGWLLVVAGCRLLPARRAAHCR